jgi:hypothetical protein
MIAGQRIALDMVGRDASGSRLEVANAQSIPKVNDRVHDGLHTWSNIVPRNGLSLVGGRNSPMYLREDGRTAEPEVATTGRDVVPTTRRACRRLICGEFLQASAGLSRTATSDNLPSRWALSSSIRRLASRLLKSARGFPNIRPTSVSRPCPHKPSIPRANRLT